MPELKNYRILLEFLVSLKKKIHMKYILYIVCIVIFAGSSVKSYSQSGNEMSVSAGAAIGVGTYSNTTYSATIIEGYRFNKYIFTGIGAGFGYSHVLYEFDIDKYGATEYRNDAYLVPVFLNVKANMPCGKISPFVSLNLGYTFDLNRNFSNAPGFMIEPAIGIDYNLTGRKAIYFLVGFNLQRGEYSIVRDMGNADGDWDLILKSEMLKAVSLRVGFKF